MSKRVLVTNDDGIDADGLRVLVGALVDHGYEPVIVAPNSDYSGAGTSILGLAGQSAELSYEERTLPEAPDAEAYAIDGPPALCVLLAIRGAFDPLPDLVVSGINFGLNTGPAVRHSGTVSAALTAAGADIPSLALSAEYVFEGEKALRYDTAAEIGMQLLPLLASSGHKVLSVNVPCADLDELAGIRSAPLAKVSRYRSFVESREGGIIKMRYGMSDETVAPETDSALIMAGFATVSSLVGASSVDCSDIVLQLSEAAA